MPFTQGEEKFSAETLTPQFLQQVSEVLCKSFVPASHRNFAIKLAIVLHEIPMLLLSEDLQKLATKIEVMPGYQNLFEKTYQSFPLDRRGRQMLDTIFGFKMRNELDEFKKYSNDFCGKLLCFFRYDADQVKLFSDSVEYTNACATLSCFTTPNKQIDTIFLYLIQKQAAAYIFSFPQYQRQAEVLYRVTRNAVHVVDEKFPHHDVNEVGNHFIGSAPRTVGEAEKMLETVVFNDLFPIKKLVVFGEQLKNADDARGDVVNYFAFDAVPNKPQREKTFGKVRVVISKITEEKSVTAAELHVTHTQAKKSVAVTVTHFKSFPAQAIDSQDEVFQKMYALVCQKDHVFVHCVTGVDMSAQMIFMLELCGRTKEIFSENVSDVVKNISRLLCELRSQRLVFLEKTEQLTQSFMFAAKLYAHHKKMLAMPIPKHMPLPLRHLFPWVKNESETPDKKAAVAVRPRYYSGRLFSLQQFVERFAPLALEGGVARPAAAPKDASAPSKPPVNGK